MINTDGSAMRNEWENASASIGVWYANGSRLDISLNLENHRNNPASNLRTKLSTIKQRRRPYNRVRFTLQLRGDMQRLGQIRGPGMVWNTEGSFTKRYPDQAKDHASTDRI